MHIYKWALALMLSVSAQAQAAELFAIPMPEGVSPVIRMDAAGTVEYMAEDGQWARAERVEVELEETA
ncbi:MAG: hypothetical protein HC902_07995, partial [Calothrix sp. SM1_5_4]|nr:hypothetical protein [Calothrix sp. SM1_5_4]